MFGNINKLNDDAHAAFLKAQRGTASAARVKGSVRSNAGHRSTAGGPHARVCRSA